MKDKDKGGGERKRNASATRMGLGGVKRKREKILLEKQTLTSKI